MKKLIATILSIVLIISIVPVGAFTALAQTDAVPDGYTTIYTVLDLYKVRYNLAGNYILMNDIDLTEATAKGGDYDYGGNGWNPIGSDDIYGNASAFTGIFDGNGYTISGMRISDSAALPSGTGSELYYGLFANNAGTIKNLHIDGSINPSRMKYIYAGGVAAYNSGTIEGCSNKVSINITSTTTSYAEYAGGIVALNLGVVKECYNAANIVSQGKSSSHYRNKYIGGISGRGDDGSLIENCYNLGDIIADNGSGNYRTYAGGIQGYSYGSSAANAKIKNCYNIGTTTVKSNSNYSSKSAITHIEYCTTVSDCYYLEGTGKNCTGATKLTPELSLIQSSYDGFDFGDVWVHNSNAIYEYPQLRDNIQDDRDLVDFEIYTLPNKTTFTKWEEFEVEGCTLKFTFTNAETEYITVTKDMVSGYDLDKVGTQTLTIKANRRELTYDIVVLEKEFIPIYTALDLYNVRNDLTANYILMNDIDLTETTAEGGDFDYGGNGWNPIGSDDIYGNASAFTGIFDGNGYAIKGMRITDSSTMPSGIGSSLYFGLFANNAGTIKNLHIEGSMKLSRAKTIYAGGVAAYNSGTIEACSNKVAIQITTTTTSYDEFAGGITAYNLGVVKECYNTANIVSQGKSSSHYRTKYIGGISGRGADGSLIENCYNLGDITADNGSGNYSAYAGGIQGYSYGPSANAKIKNCYNIGTTTVKSNASSYSKSAITYIYNYTTVSDCYYLEGTGKNCTGATSLSATLLKEPSVLKNFDFDVVWTMAGSSDYDYPELQCFPISGEIGILGDVAYLSAVEPNLNDVYSADETYTCEWLVNGVVKANTKTYTLQMDDIGKKLKLKVIGTDDYNKGVLYSNEYTVSKAIQTADPVVPAEVLLNDNKFEITTVSTQEYSIDNTNWQQGGVFANLDPNKEYTVYTRILENDLYLLGESKAVLTVTTDRRPLSGEVKISGTPRYSYTLSADLSNLLPKNATYSYEWKRNNEIVGTGSRYTLVKDDIGATITLSVIGNGDFIGIITSAPITATKDTVQAPAAPVVSNRTNTTVILVAKTGYEYSLDKVNWQTNPTFTGLFAATEYTFYQRIAETETDFASAISSGTKATTLKNTVSAPSKPEITDVTNTTVTLKKINGYEYSMDGATWQKSNVFTGLDPYTEYFFCQRIAETAVDYASGASGYTSVVTLKNTTKAPTAPTVLSATDTTVTLQPINGYQYSIDGVTWQNSNVFSGLTTLKTYNFYQRIAETEIDYASPASGATAFKLKHIAGKPAAPTLISVTNNRIEVEAKAGYEYSKDGTTWQTSGVFTGLSPNTQYNIYCRFLESDTYYASEDSDALVVTTLKNTVSKPSAPTLAGKTANSITLVAVSGYEYSKNGTTWQTSNVFNGLSPNTTYTFYQRIAETATSYVSESSNALTVTTPKSTPNKPSAPTVYSKTYDTVTLNAISGYDYSRDGVNWQTSNVFAGLSPNTTYYFYQRIIETDTSYTSEKSSSLAVTTLKMSTYTPSKPVAVKVTQTSVELQKYTDYEYSKDGANWQTNNVFNNLSVNTTYTFYQRVAATNTTYAGSTSAGLQVKTNSKANCSVAPAKPIVAEITTSKVVLVAREGYEYSKNGTTWQTSNTFSGLSSNTSYTFYQRIAETGSELASSTSAGVTVKTRTTVSGTTAATNYDKLRNYISTYGSTNSDGYKNLVSSQTTSSGLTAYYSVENISSGIRFTFLTSSSKSSKLVGLTQFTLTRSSKTLSTYTQLLYYYNGTCKDAVSASSSIDRSTYSISNTYTLNQSGNYYITSSIFSENYNDTLVLLCDYWDTYFYSKLGFGLKGLGFVSYNGYGSTVCDSLCSYHSGSYETRNAYSAGCDYDGYTGDKYCTKCGTLVSSGTTISCTGQHSYSNSCDKTCNSCGEERAIEHTYSNDCDTKCNYCNAERDAHHVYNNECDANCNNCGHERKVSHIYDNKDDLICNCCGHERPPYTPGDLDDNDDVTDRDAVHLLYHTFLPDLYPVNQDCDFNNDGYVNDKDAVYLLYHTFLPDLYPLN